MCHLGTQVTCALLAQVEQQAWVGGVVVELKGLQDNAV
jgi:hypothetical protein